MGVMVKGRGRVRGECKGGGVFDWESLERWFDDDIRRLPATRCRSSICQASSDRSYLLILEFSFSF